MRTLLPALLVTALFASGCPSAYQRTYDQETQRLEAEQRAREQQLEEQRREARKFVAVVLFAVGSADIDEAGARELEWFLEQLAPFPQLHVDVKGYTDSTGSEANNHALSNQRAWAVQDYLISRGFSADHVSVSAYGEAEPARPNETAPGRKQNRRAEVRVR